MKSVFDGSVDETDSANEFSGMCWWPRSFHQPLDALSASLKIIATDAFALGC